ncbi:MAG TPA: aminotransferase class I/II-fold pyridoxal phosphate-dependent enzyme [Candidatus Limiplasma sp.]|nr:aminotransferase class I/II-fold pyridoxal phosphate-dependent enzyme [Candidatus Limiplasma sp.]
MKAEQIALEHRLDKAPQVRDMLSAYGRRVYFAKDGVLGQSWEAREKAYQFNATLGEAQAQGRTIYSPSLQAGLAGLQPEQLYPYAKPAGLPELRARWRGKMLSQNPSMRAEALSLPVVTCGLTHALSLAAELFLDPDDPVVVHDKHWENYEQIFTTHYGAKLYNYPTFAWDGFNLDGLRNTLTALPGSKAMVLLNFPNNPTGYCFTKAEAEAVRDVLRKEAEHGRRMVVVVDDAYYGLWYDGEALQESLAGILCGVHPNVLVVRIDGVTKEFFAGGLRVGFLTFMGQDADILGVLEEKAAGAVRAFLSSTSRPAQEIVLRGLKDDAFGVDMRAGAEILIQRGKYVLKRCCEGSADGLWVPYPFRGGYFLCLRMQNAPSVRRILLDEYGIGVIAMNQTDLRISFPCLEIGQLETLFNLMDEAARKAL